MSHCCTFARKNSRSAPVPGRSNVGITDASTTAQRLDVRQLLRPGTGALRLGQLNFLQQRDGETF